MPQAIFIIQTQQAIRCRRPFRPAGPQTPTEPTAVEFKSSSICALSIPVFPLASSLSSTARTSIGGCSPSLCARCQRLMRAMPMHGCYHIKLASSDLPQNDLK
jgi:hypothetical protein